MGETRPLGVEEAKVPGKKKGSMEHLSENSHEPPSCPTAPLSEAALESGWGPYPVCGHLDAAKVEPQQTCVSIWSLSGQSPGDSSK